LPAAPHPKQADLARHLAQLGVWPSATVVFGELGLLGEVRAVADTPLRLKEALALGFRGAILPAGNGAEAAAFPDLQATPVRTVEELLAKI
jgi:DNA repair protein RadA/Sms